jgi:hypothetical protein
VSSTCQSRAKLAAGSKLISDRKSDLPVCSFLSRLPFTPFRLSAHSLNRYGWGSKVIAVHVGGIPLDGIDERMYQTFHVHDQLIRARSPFFDKALSHDWKEKTERMVELPTADPMAFNLYMDFIYSKCIILDPTQGDSEQYSERLGLAYSLGDILLDTDFKDAVIDVILHRVLAGHDYPFSLNKYAFEHTPAEWPLRQLLTDLLALRGQESWLTEENMKLLTEEALQETLKAMFRNKALPVPRDGSFRYENCKEYHCHTKENTPCYRETIGLSTLLPALTLGLSPSLVSGTLRGGFSLGRRSARGGLRGR